ncbi:uncharacterized protein PGTG_11867 [Puccinia graminis f. sp. tritici CRL 75-36-700-3]|uniref:Uncharacterized protein n=1 Tax=Puccinia graminis f. sp. tritici (strain CRL 75-36-700-3 / race SCCL) TaxID=418459 RepID=E3KMI6_PUCGT|nr:uncharacterized protein PGTG_11867 [Puccinia graminis f. sp. tritici CRL 75-36-700-3]EFP85511.1 hypothetical protein PGTG_11867 [Puccinia graminis f. sp. tritici CRL 75-36-700-3]
MGAFQGLVKAVAVRTEREAEGKALNGMHFDSIRAKQQKNGGQIEDGIVLSNFERVAGDIKNLGYSGPLALVSDQTVCLYTIQVPLPKIPLFVVALDVDYIYWK